ncbi:ABC transporter substrate-binding protein [Sediminispirochaeta bajacaliforniensis]|uniref:ABC transporter substrate-binding protein n=1 Tax=Sediminispirochaeta bajacaliforniensis TaxID=148 RepID=UPI0003628004|nr:extracellular solute-binding protein [Sediminispirochaeta bajacaliforniensis]
MNRRTSIMISLVLCLVVTGSLFAGGESEKKAESGKTTITWWALSGGGGADDVRETYRRDLISEYEAAHPNVDIELTMLENEAFKQKVQVAIQAGNPPDIFHSWGGGVMVEYAQVGALKDITDFAERELSSSIGSGALGVYGYDGKYYGSPYDMGAVGLWYNKAIFAKLGTDVPKTWPELLDIVKKAKAAGYIPIALGGGDRWPAHYWWVYLAMRIGGQEAFNAAYGGSGSFKDETFVKAGEMLLDLAALEPFQTGFLGSTYDDESALMGNGKAAMELMGQWAPAVQSANSESGKGIGDDLGWFSFPAVPGGVGKNSDVMGGGNGYVIGAKAPEETLDFLKFFLSKKNNMELHKIEGIIPVVKGAEEVLASNPNAVKIAQAVAGADYYQLYYDQFLPPSVGETIKDAVMALLAGKASPEEAATMIDDSWQAEK